MKFQVDTHVGDGGTLLSTLQAVMACFEGPVIPQQFQELKSLLSDGTPHTSPFLLEKMIRTGEALKSSSSEEELRKLSPKKKILEEGMRGMEPRGARQQSLLGLAVGVKEGSPGLWWSVTSRGRQGGGLDGRVDGEKVT